MISRNVRAVGSQLVLSGACAAAVALTLVALPGCDESKLQLPPPSASAKSTGMASATATATAEEAPLPPMPKAPPLEPAPKSLGEPKVPSDNPLTAEKVALGKQLFFDKRLSKGGVASCETCHVPEKGWTDGNAVSTKVDGKPNTRHSPTLINVAYNDLWYWDGRSPTLEKQVEAAWKGQMSADPAAVAETIGKIPGYRVQFKTIFGHEATGPDVVQALASFVRTIRSGDAPWDAHDAGDKKAVGDDAARGFELFRNKAGCAGCHAPPLYTDNGFHDTGVGFDKPEPDLGRGKISKNEKENGAFKTPTLRSVGTHPPYFHDGATPTLDAAVTYMLSGGIKDKNPNLDAKMKKVTLSAKERGDLLAFVKALETPAKPFDRPTLPQ